MNFSEPVTVPTATLALSPNSKYIASSSQNKLTLRSVSTLNVFQHRKCMGIINSLVWSPDSSRIICVLKKLAVVQVYSVDEPEWMCQLDEGAAGILSAEWAPDSLHVLNVSDFNLQITVWSLSGTNIAQLKYAKPHANKLPFSPCGRYLALLQRHEFRDQLSIFDRVNNWALLQSLELNTQDAVGVLWSADGRYLAIWDECLRYRITIYTLDGRNLKTYCAYEPCEQLLGVKSVCWSPIGPLLAIGSYDEQCRILSGPDWECLATLPHPTTLPINPHLGLGPVESDENLSYRPHRVDVYEEFRSPMNTDESLSNSKEQLPGVVYRLVDDPVLIRSTRPDPKLPFPKIGIGLLAFSTDGHFLACRNDNAAHVVWIWSLDHRLSLFSLLIHSNAVTCLVWDPTSPARLAICTGSDAFFMWTPQGCLAVQVPAHFKFLITSISWFSNNDALLLKSETQFTFCYLQNSDPTVQPIIWEPPKPTMLRGVAVELPLDSPLPRGGFGDSMNETMGDEPKWLKQRRTASPSKRNDPHGELCVIDSRRGLPSARTAVAVPHNARQAWVRPSMTDSSGRVGQEQDDT